jgi:glycine cleavage system aminomethyltransferase T
LVAGPSSQRLLNKVSSLRFTGRGPADRLVAEGSLATIRALILRRQWQLPAFECFFERSYAAFLWEAVIDAGEEFGAIPCGWEAVVEASRSESNP